MAFAGVDAGSRTIKVVLLDDGGSAILGSAVADQGVRQAERAEELYARALGAAGLDRADVAAVVATGLGRTAIGFAARTMTEITCQARGIHHLHPAARSVIDVGGQDSKVLRLDAGGRVLDFAMNDRCAAGTGRFLEIAARLLDLPLAALGTAALGAEAFAAVTTMCAVFAETEIIGLLAAGVPPAAIAAGVQRAIAARLVALAGRRLDPPTLLTGGVALIPGMDRALAAAAGRPVAVAAMAQCTAALGAALLARGA
ncbi:MAG: acyl-CoA dehydratase activase [Planctomycetota bacterium]